MNVQLPLRPVTLMRDVSIHTEVLSVLVTLDSSVTDGHVLVSVKCSALDGGVCESVNREMPP